MVARHSFYRSMLFALSVVLRAPVTQPQEVEHRIVFKFDYDFSVTPTCSAKMKQNCVQQFVFYDISRGIAKRIRIGSMPAPADAIGLVKGISGKSDLLLFNRGKHIVAVAAQMADGSESDLGRCATTVKIP